MPDREITVNFIGVVDGSSGADAPVHQLEPLDFVPPLFEASATQTETSITPIRAALIEVRSCIKSECLEVAIDYSNNRHDEHAMQSLLESIRAGFEELIHADNMATSAL